VPLPVELSFPGTFAPVERKVQELLLHGTFAPVELSLLRSECHKNFCSLELSLSYLKNWGKAFIKAVYLWAYLAMVVGLKSRVETFSLQKTQYIVDELDLLRCVKL